MQVLFNLLFNSTGSFVAGILTVLLTLRLFRIGTSRWKLAFLVLPFLKILWDMHGGIPATSFMKHGIDPLALPARHKMFTIGLGFSDFHPDINFVFAVKDAARHYYSISAADFIWALLKRANPLAPPVLLLGLIAVSLTLVLRRAMILCRFEARRKQAFSDPRRSRILNVRELPFRNVPIIAADSFSGSPFTGGVLRPYVCLPAECMDRLSSPELEAVIEHELAHVRSFDLPINLIIQVLGDVFWFVPGYRRVSQKIDRLREILADDSAVKQGASAAHLASSLLKLNPSELAPTEGMLYSAFAKDASLLRERVERLAGCPVDEKPPRLGWNHPWLRWAIAAFMALTVFSANVGGNYDFKPIPDWLSHWLDQHGLHVQDG